MQPGVKSAPEARAVRKTSGSICLQNINEGVSDLELK